MTFFARFFVLALTLIAATPIASFAANPAEKIETICDLSAAKKENFDSKATLLPVQLRLTTTLTLTDSGSVSARHFEISTIKDGSVLASRNEKLEQAFLNEYQTSYIMNNSSNAPKKIAFIPIDGTVTVLLARDLLAAMGAQVLIINPTNADKNGNLTAKSFGIDPITAGIISYASPSNVNDGLTYKIKASCISVY